MVREDTSHLLAARERRPYGPTHPPRYAPLERERRPYSEARFSRGRSSEGVYERERERRPYAHDLASRGSVFTERERRPYRQTTPARSPTHHGGGGHSGRGHGYGGAGYGGGDYVMIRQLRVDSWW